MWKAIKIGDLKVHGQRLTPLKQGSKGHLFKRPELRSKTRIPELTFNSSQFVLKLTYKQAIHRIQMHLERYHDA